MSKYPRLRHAFLLILLSLCALMSLFFAALFGVLFHAPETSKNMSDSFRQTSSIYREDGTLLEKIESTEFRTNVSLSQIPKDLQHAFIAIEDRRFYQHKGIDPRGIAGSLLQNLSAGRVVRGGSTITQQLVKNVYLTSEQSLNRKLTEAYLSLRLETTMEKDEILEAYLNRVNLGQGAYGVQGAAQTYFSKNVEDLDLAECALLAGIVKSPREYQPFLRLPEHGELPQEEPMGHTEVAGEPYLLYFNPKSLERQKIVLSAMRDMGFIDEERYRAAYEEDVKSHLHPVEKRPHRWSSYATDFIRAQATDLIAKHYMIPRDVAEEKLFDGGFRIVTTIDDTLQHGLEDIYRNFSELLLSRTPSTQGAHMLSFSRDDFGNVIDPQGEILFFLRKNLYDEAGNLILSSDDYHVDPEGNLALSRRLFAAVDSSLRLRDSYLIDDNRLFYSYTEERLPFSEEEFSLQGDWVLLHHDAVAARENLFDFSKDVLTVHLPEATKLLQPQGSCIVIDNDSSTVKAIVGGLDLDSRRQKILNRVLASPRQPGTALLPFSVYGPALQQGILPSASYDDRLYDVDGQWWPTNPFGTYLGEVTMRRAFETGSHPVPYQMLKDAPFTRSMNFLQRVGLFRPLHPERDAIVSDAENREKNDFTFDALSQVNLVRGTTLYDLSASFEALSGNGSYRLPYAISEIEDAEGNLIFQLDKTASIPAMKVDVAFYLRDMMRTNVLRGGAKLAQIPGIETAAVLGTNKFSSDLWVMGLTPQYTIGSWIGCDRASVTLTDSPSMAFTLWRQAASSLPHEKVAFEIPEGMGTIKISNKSGLLATQATRAAGAAVDEFFREGRGPTEFCPHHQSLLICETSGLLATQFCPEETVARKIYYLRDNPYAHGPTPPVYPLDLSSVPKSYCNIHTRSWFEEQQENEEKPSSAKQKASSSREHR